MRAEARGRAAIPLLGSFESAYQPDFDNDNFESSEHDLRWQSDLHLLAATGVARTRYPVRWHRVETSPGVFDWRFTDRTLGWLHDHGMGVTVDLVHHTSYPRWLDGFTDPRFAHHYLRYVEAFARRYPWVDEYTLFNELFTTIQLCGFEGLWPPRRQGIAGFVELALAIVPMVAEASRMAADLLPGARHVYVDSCERARGVGAAGEEYAAYANDRRFTILDAFLGGNLDPGRPFVADLLRHGGEALLGAEPGRIDVLGLDYYAHSQWDFTGPQGQGQMCSAQPASLAALIVEYAERYRVPVILGETNIRGYASDRATWLKYTLEQCEVALDAGVDVRGYCWFPFLDSCDWDSVLCRCEGNVDPVGVYWLDDRLERRASCMSDSFTLAARGDPSAALPAYRLREPVAGWLRGWLPQMTHWEWQDPPIYATDPPPPAGPIELRIEDARH